MHQPPVAFPAFSLMIDELDGGIMASYTIGLEYVPGVRCKPDVFGDPAGIEEKNIFQSVNRFPSIMDALIAVRQMAVNAHGSPVGALMHEGLVFRPHNVTAHAEFGRLRFGQHLHRSQQDEIHDSRHGDGGNDNIPDDRFAPVRIHSFTSLQYRSSFIGVTTCFPYYKPWL
jgi:hypothetical protein